MGKSLHSPGPTPKMEIIKKKYMNFEKQKSQCKWKIMDWKNYLQLDVFKFLSEPGCQPVSKLRNHLLQQFLNFCISQMIQKENKKVKFTWDCRFFRLLKMKNYPVITTTYFKKSFPKNKKEFQIKGQSLWSRGLLAIIYSCVWHRFSLSLCPFLGTHEQ